jgi:chemotaxis protein MotB
MARSSNADSTDTGIVLGKHERLPVPKQRVSEPRLSPPPRSNARRTLLILVAGVVSGGAAGYLVRPALSPDPRLAQLATLEQAASAAQATAKGQRDRADLLANQLEQAAERQQTLEAELVRAKQAQTQLADKVAGATKEAEAQRAKLTAAIDKAGSVSSDGDEITLQLVDKVLFKLGDDQLTERGKQVLAKVGQALGELPDKQIWVQGHTDDTPIVVPPPPRRPGKGAAAAGQTIKFPTNWELSAARALTVVHYLQDVAKLDPTRLAALAFGQYRPVSRGSKALNRRIEIVLYPYKARIRK